MRFMCVMIRAYHEVWLEQIANGCVTWSDAMAKLEFHWALLWHTTPPYRVSKQVSTTHPPKRPASLWSNTMVMANLGMKVCAVFNMTSCTHQGDHHELHICTFCLTSVNHQCEVLQEAVCCSKKTRWGGGLPIIPIRYGQYKDYDMDIFLCNNPPQLHLSQPWPESQALTHFIPHCEAITLTEGSCGLLSSQLGHGHEVIAVTEGSYGLCTSQLG